MHNVITVVCMCLLIVLLGGAHSLQEEVLYG